MAVALQSTTATPADVIEDAHWIYRDMAKSVGFEGHIDWAEAMG